MTLQPRTLEDAVKEIQRFAKPTLSEDELDATTRIAVDAIQAAGDRPLTDKESAELKRTTRRALAQTRGLEDT